MSRSSRLLPMLPLALTLACGEKDGNDDDDGGDHDSGDAAALECVDPRTSRCDTEAAIVRGSVSLAPGLLPEVTEGTLYVALTHDAYYGELGGGYHTSTMISGADLAAGPVSFELDMCEGGAMWSEENCDYGLVVILDGNGNQGSNNLLPDAGEPATRHGPVTLSCSGESPCYDIQLDCTDGASCVQFTSPASCACSEDSCGSDYAICG